MDAVTDDEATEKFKKFVEDRSQTLDEDQILNITQLHEFVNRLNDGFNIRIPSSCITIFAIQQGIMQLIEKSQGKV